MGKRIIECENNKDKLETVLHNYEESIHEINLQLNYCLKFILFPLISIFYSYFIFDISGNKVGSKYAKYTFILSIILPLLLLINEKKKRIKNKDIKDIKDLNIDNIELNQVTINQFHNDNTNA